MVTTGLTAAGVHWRGLVAALERATISSCGSIGSACRSVGSASECVGSACGSVRSACRSVGSASECVGSARGSVGSACGSVRSDFCWLKSPLELTFYTQGVQFTGKFKVLQMGWH